MHRYPFPASQLLLASNNNKNNNIKNNHSSTTSRSGNPTVSLDATTTTPSTTTTATVSSPSASREIHSSIAAVLPGDLYNHDTLNSSLDYDHGLNNSTTTTGATTRPSTQATTTLAATTENPIAFNYLLAASWHPKKPQRQRQQEQKRREEAAAAAATNGETTMRWKRKLRAMGVDPSLFSWALMNNAENIARLTDSVPIGASASAATTTEAGDNRNNNAHPRLLTASSERKVLDAQSILDGAYSELVQSGTVEGSSTACILSLCKLTGTLKASNLGDSAFLVIRDNQCIYESPSQQHSWNCPYQLTVLPPRLRQQQGQQPTIITTTTAAAAATVKSPETNAPKKKKSRYYIEDLPEDAAQTTQQLQDGDVIVLATDGFWDNVFTKETIKLVDSELGDIIRQQQRRQQHQVLQQMGGSIGTGIEAATAATVDNGDGSSDMMLGHGVTKEEVVVPEMTADEILARVRVLSKRLTNTARGFSLDSKRMTPFGSGG
ncbi:hypothetical protein BGZ65_005219 [Modicella reniformis]|uniref:Protein phosphatase n=1 Tax=Modicella reniformis TaxID=1440133 RepID=A0A9P6INC7_9FUNG|nr:hypothetical protein BGZ65_005219 [Modicella reniformis]